MNYTDYAVNKYRESFRRLYGREPTVEINHGWIKVNNSSSSHRPSQIVEMAVNLDERVDNDDEERFGFFNEIEVIPAEEEADVAIEMSAIEMSLREMEMENRRREEEMRQRELLEELRRVQFRDEMIKKIKEDNCEYVINHNSNDVWDVRDELRTSANTFFVDSTEGIINDTNTDTPAMGWQKNINKDTIVRFLNRVFEECGNSAFNMEREMDEFSHTGSFLFKDNNLEEMAEEIEHLENKTEEQYREIRFLRMKSNDYKEKLMQYKKLAEEREKKIKEIKDNSVIFSMDF